MKKYSLFLATIFIALLFNACSEAGLTGPEGPAGPSGPAGAVGAAGKDGSIMYSGTGVPATTVGVNGDYYLDKNNGNLYGPKTVSGWGTPFTIMGAVGANGANGTNGTNGTTTLSGNGTPATTVGVNGDYFLDKTNYLLYGPKTAAGWGTPILLRGADGAQGPTGAAGKDGSIMYSGTGSPAAALGLNGDYYLDKTTGNLYGPKAVGAWGSPLILKGATGANGTNGTNGSTTLSGNGAPATTIGVNGDYYLDRTNYLLYGPKSAIGWGTALLLRGAQGAQGPMGPTGADGTVIYSGETAPDPALGKAGDFYISRLPVMLYGPKNANLDWGMGTSLKGADGANGTNGNTILNGGGPPQGTQGNNGDYYIDLTTYMMYGPKAGGSWPFPGTSLRGADGNSNVIALETEDTNTFSWVGEWDNRVLRRQGTVTNDTSTVFTIPTIYNAAVRQGIVSVYMRKNNGDGSYSWQQLNFTDKSPGYTVVYVHHLRINPTDAKLRILYGDPYATHGSFPVDKVRIVIAPQSSSGVLSNINQNTPMLQTMQKFNLRDTDFKKLK